MNYEIWSLHDIIIQSDSNTIEGLRSDLLTFVCEKDVDVQNFLHTKSVYFDKKDKTRTYLIVDNTSGSVNILGYFSIAIKVLTVPEDLSGSKKKKLDGKYSNIENGISAYLIGQLGKNDIYKDRITGRQILLEAFNIIKEAQSRVGGRVVYIECCDTPQLIKFYEQNGFTLFNRDPKSGLMQMLTYINKV